jgi:hypothetical protein
MNPPNVVELRQLLAFSQSCCFSLLLSIKTLLAMNGQWSSLVAAIRPDFAGQVDNGM